MKENPMSKKSVFCITTSRPQADRIVDQLRSANFSNNDISVLFPDKDTTRDFAHEKNTKAPEGAVAGASTGGVVGGALGWIVGIGALAIPGVGPFIAAGPIMAALGGAAIGAAAGGIAGGLIGLGIPELEAKRYEGKVKAGNILISVHTEDSDEIDRAKDIFEKGNRISSLRIPPGKSSPAPKHKQPPARGGSGNLAPGDFFDHSLTNERK
jgi:hypothetical protein